MINKKIDKTLNVCLINFKLDLFKIFRYIKLTGFSRTLSKVNGLYHLDKTDGFSGDFLGKINKYKSLYNDKNSNTAIIDAVIMPTQLSPTILVKLTNILRATLDIESQDLVLCAIYKGDYATTSLQKY